MDSKGSRKTDFEVPYRSLAYYIGKHVRVYMKNNPLLDHPTVYEDVLSAIFDDPPAILLEEAEILVLDYIPLRDYYRVSKRRGVGAVFVKMDELRFFEILGEETLTEFRIPHVPSEIGEKAELK